MTEDEAKAKFCCGPSWAGIYRDETDPDTRRCAGSACMGWRWHNPTISNGELLWERNTQGFCGLAGKP